MVPMNPSRPAGWPARTWHGIRRRKTMALTFHYKAGEAQSRAAGRYFELVATELLGTRLDGLDARPLVITQDDEQPMPLRLWSTSDPTPENLGDLVPWIRQVHSEMHDLGLRATRPSMAAAFAQQWMETRHGDRTFFAEMLDPAHAFSPDEDNVLSVGVIGGETVLLSARNVMFVKLARDQFGLAIASKGSFLIERGAGLSHSHALRA